MKSFAGRIIILISALFFLSLGLTQYTVVQGAKKHLHDIYLDKAVWIAETTREDLQCRYDFYSSQGNYLSEQNRTRLETSLEPFLRYLSKGYAGHRTGTSGSIYIHDGSGMVISHPVYQGKNLAEIVNPQAGTTLKDAFSREGRFTTGTLQYRWKDQDDPADDYSALKTIYFTYFEPLDWYIGSAFAHSEYHPVIWSLSLTLLGVILFTDAAALLIALLLLKSLSRQLTQLNRSIQESQEKGVPQHPVLVSGTAEVGKLARTINTMVGSLGQYKKDLEEEQDSFMEFIDKAPYIISKLTPQGMNIYFNPAGEIITGYTQEELADKSWWETFYPGEGRRQVEAFYRTLKEKAVVQSEMVLTTKSGEKKTIVWDNLLIRDERGDLKEIIGFGKDVTDQRRIEEELRSAEARNRAILEAIPDLIFNFDAQGRFVDFKADTGRLYSDDPFIGKRIDQVMPPEISSSAMEQITACLTTGKPGCLYYQLPGKTGRTNYYEARFIRLKEDRVMAIIRDITEQTLQEEELHQLREYLSRVIDSMPSVIIGVNRQREITQWNQGAASVTGISAEEAQGRILEEAFPALLPHLSLVSDCLDKKKTVQIKKHPADFGDDVSHYTDITVFPVGNEKENRAVIRIDDVSNQVQMEQMVIQSEKMLSVGGLAAGMAHEINNPLAGMIQSADVLAQRLGDTQLKNNRKTAEELGIPIDTIHSYMESRKIFSIIQDIKDSGIQAARIVRNMLSFARKTSSSMSCQDLTLLIERILDLASTDYNLKKQFDFKSIGIKKEFQENLPEVPCEDTQIQQVVFNILRNGAEAMEEKKLKRAAEGDLNYQPEFSLRLLKDEEENEVRLEIEDNGPGLDRETRKHIFEPFFTTKPVGVGTGLGLSVSYFIITENHGGSISVQPGAAGGCCFIIRLPLPKEEA